MNALNEMPSSWRDFVKVTDILETDTKIQSAIWELVTTEVDYIHAIQTVTDVSIIYSENCSNLYYEILTRRLLSHKKSKFLNV
jgi:pleckstrin homology domain-containing family G member 5